MIFAGLLIDTDRIHSRNSSPSPSTVGIIIEASDGLKVG